MSAVLSEHTLAAEPPPQLNRWLAPQAWQRDTEGPIVSLGASGEFDDTHIFAPAVAIENDQVRLWYCGSHGTPSTRVFRLGLATSSDGKQFEKHAGNPVFQFVDGVHSVLTPALLRQPDGTLARENGKLRMWFASTAFGNARACIRCTKQAVPTELPGPSRRSPLLENVYCPTVLKTGDSYQMWFTDVRRRPWVIRHAESSDGTHWNVTPRPVLGLSQDWEAEIVVYPTVLKIDGVYLMWYGSYYHACGARPRPLVLPSVSTD